MSVLNPRRIENASWVYKTLFYSRGCLSFFDCARILFGAILLASLNMVHAI